MSTKTDPAVTGPLSLKTIRLGRGPNGEKLRDRIRVEGAVGGTAFNLQLAGGCAVGFKFFREELLKHGFDPTPHGMDFDRAVHAAINAGNDWHPAGCKDPAAAARFHKPASPRPTPAPAPAQPKPQLQAKPTPPAPPKPAPAAPKLSAAESAAAEKLYAMFERFGREAGGKYFRLGLSVEQAGKLHGTRLGNAFLRHDPSAELNGFDAAGLFHLSAADWPLYAPKADREYGGSRYWKLKSLAAWAAAGVPGRNGKPNPELLARLGGVGKDESLTARECQLGGRRAAAIADGIKLPGRGK